MSESYDLYGNLVATARAVVMTCILGPATDVAHGDVRSEAGLEARGAAATLDHIGWPGEALRAIPLSHHHRTVVRRAALAGLAASAEAVREAAEMGSTGDGAWSGFDAVTEIDGIVALLDHIGWPEHLSPPPRERLGVVADSANGEHRDPSDIASELLEPLHDAYVVIDRDGVIANACPRFCAMTGFDREQLVGQGPPYPFWPEENAAWMGERLVERLGQVHPSKALTIGRRRNGQPFVMKTASAPILSAEGTLMFMLVVVSDDRARRRASRAVIESEKRFRELTDTFSIPVWFLDANGSGVRHNRAGQEALGVTEFTDAAVWSALIVEADRQRVLNLMDAAIAEQRPIRAQFRLNIRTVETLVDVAGDPLLDVAGGFCGYAGTTILRADSPRIAPTTLDPITWLSSAEGTLSFISDAAAAVLDHASTRRLADISSIVHPDDRPLLAGALEDAHAARCGFDLTVRATCRDGSCRRLAIHADARFEAGEFAGFVGAMLDVGGPA